MLFLIFSLYLFVSPSFFLLVLFQSQEEHTLILRWRHVVQPCCVRIPSAKCFHGRQDNVSNDRWNYIPSTAFQSNGAEHVRAVLMAWHLGPWQCG